MGIKTKIFSLTLFLLFLMSTAYAAVIIPSKIKNHTIYEIKSLTVISNNNNNKGLISYDPTYDIVSSGTFYYENLKKSVAPVLTADENLYLGNPKALTRGTVFKLADGKIIVARIPNENFSYQNTNMDEVSQILKNNIHDIEEKYQQDVVELMGGGALLIENGQKVSRDDLIEKQFFDQGIGQLTGAQMRAAQHVLIATKEDRAYIILSGIASAAQLQTDLSLFDNVVKFDGGSGCSFFVGNNKNLCSGHNVTGFGILLLAPASQW